MINREKIGKKFNNYCVNMMKMYNFGRVNMPV